MCGVNRFGKIKKKRFKGKFKSNEHKGENVTEQTLWILVDKTNNNDEVGVIRVKRILLRRGKPKKKWMETIEEDIGRHVMQKRKIGVTDLTWVR